MSSIRRKLKTEIKGFLGEKRMEKLHKVVGGTRYMQGVYLLENLGRLPFNMLLKKAGHLRHSCAQHFQDVVALNYLPKKEKGYFVEIGVGNGKDISNTFLFEKYLGWQGLLCEPNPESVEHIQKVRTATLDRRAVYSQSGLELDFLSVSNSDLSTLLEYQQSDHHKRLDVKKTKVQTVSASDLFTEHSVPEHVDFISIDTEGSEIEILKTLPFNKHSFGFICVEHNDREEHKKQMDDIIIGHGYKRVLTQASSCDYWYVPVNGA